MAPIEPLCHVPAGKGSGAILGAESNQKWEGLLLEQFRGHNLKIKPRSYALEENARKQDEVLEPVLRQCEKNGCMGEPGCAAV